MPKWVIQKTPLVLNTYFPPRSQNFWYLLGRRDLHDPPPTKPLNGETSMSFLLNISLGLPQPNGERISYVQYTSAGRGLLENFIWFPLIFVPPAFPHFCFALYSAVINCGYEFKYMLSCMSTPDRVLPPPTTSLPSLHLLAPHFKGEMPNRGDCCYSQRTFIFSFKALYKSWS